MSGLEIGLWASLAIVGYAYVGYPILIWVLSRERSNAGAHRDDGLESTLEITLPNSAQEWPLVTLVLAAYKEERYILDRLHNAVALDYPADRLEIIVGCDGNEDCTGELVQGFGDARVRLVQFPERRGKASVLNDLVPQARGSILLFSDANTMMEPQALRRLVQHFDDAAVGGVCGKLILTDPVTGRNVDSLYWKYENFLKTCEGRRGALLGANGGIYAIRHELYEPIPANTIIDDFLIGMRIYAQGSQLLYDPAALAFEETPPSLGAEFHRRARIGAGGFQSLAHLWPLLNPKYGWLAFAFLSHKVLRWICPAFLVAALACNAALAADPFYLALLQSQAAFYAASAIGFWIPGSGLWQRPFRVAALFVSMNLALVVGFTRWVRGIRNGTWKRTERTAEPTAEPAESAEVTAGV